MNLEMLVCVCVGGGGGVVVYGCKSFGYVSQFPCKDNIKFLVISLFLVNQP